MKLFYYRANEGNFGDDLNPWIWNTLAPEILDEDEARLLVGIGSIINDKVPADPHKIVFGSGVGYHSAPLLDEKWNFLCVRGPLSARTLKLPPSVAITDAAVLLSEVVGKTPVVSDGSVCFMPHHVSVLNADWKPISELAGIVHLDPLDDVRQLVKKIRQSRLVIAEAMHAAIVADTFRVPWLPVTCYDHIFSFKWRDWCQSMNIEYRPVHLPRIWELEKRLPRHDVRKSRIKRGLQKVGIWANLWTTPFPPDSTVREKEKAASALAALAASGKGFLSEERRHCETIEQLMEKLALLKRHHRRLAG
jgi:succinoglycan biosynthesis protein ExoV